MAAPEQRPLNPVAVRLFEDIGKQCSESPLWVEKRLERREPRDYRIGRIAAWYNDICAAALDNHQSGSRGLDLLTVTQAAGTSGEMIEDHYGHLRQEHAREGACRAGAVARCRLSPTISTSSGPAQKSVQIVRRACSRRVHERRPHIVFACVVQFTATISANGQSVIDVFRGGR